MISTPSFTLLNHGKSYINQFFRGLPTIVDLAAMRDAVKDLGGDPKKINPLCPAELIIDHAMHVDYFGR